MKNWKVGFYYQIELEGKHNAEVLGEVFVLANSASEAISVCERLFKDCKRLEVMSANRS